MSQNTENQVQVSEDLFTTQDLLDDPIHLENETTSKSPQNEAQSLDLNNLQSEDLEVQESADYDIAASDELMEEELEPEIDDTEGITEDIEEDLEVRDEITEGTEVEVAEVVQEVVEGTEKDASKKKVVRVSSLQRISELPLSKVKHIIKLDPDVKLVSNEAVFLITKATEFFVKTLAKESFNHATQQKKKTMTKAHVDQALTMLPIELM